MKSTDFLQAAIDVQAERGKQYDQPTGERSMGRTVAAFNAVTGRDLTEAEGWLLLQLLKDVRQWQNPSQYHHDSALDGVAYASLKAEALHAAGVDKTPSEKTRRALDEAREIKEAFAEADMLDWRNWQVGDLLEIVAPNNCSVPAGTLCTVLELDVDDSAMPARVSTPTGDTGWPEAVDIDGHLCVPRTHPFRWHSRPAN